MTLDEMEAAVAKIDRRIADLDAFDVLTVSSRSDPRIKALEHRLDDWLTSTFGPDTVEYQRYQYSVAQLDTARESWMEEVPLHEIVSELQRGLASSRAELLTIRSGLLEELEDAGRTRSGKALRAYAGLELHPAIERAAGSLFRGGHYANAIEDAVKALNALVRLNSGVEDKDGTALMEFVFSPKNPILRLNNLKDQSDQDEQRGFMMMFSGAVAGLRNPRAHRIMKDDPEKALEFISFISLLAKSADATTR